MSHQNFFCNRDYIEYVRLLFELHRAISEGWDETEAGEALRDRLDEPGDRLSSDEIASVSAIAADFYSLTDAPNHTLSPMTAQDLADLQPVFQHRDRKQFHDALELLRKHAESIPSASLAYMRGRIWMEAEEHQIAAAFLNRASFLDPNNANFRYMALHALWNASPASAIKLAQAILSNWQQHPPRLVLKSLDVLMQSIRAESACGTPQELQSYIPIFEDSIFQFETSGDAETDLDLLDNSFNHLDFLQHR